ncbi:hypothetical protein C8J57DRAFT_1218668 [Mycena rebaudengoi]|nr:hypothetical protein C8J57DRAFT_1218668 [Mycena rebaudengoi]
MFKAWLGLDTRGPDLGGFRYPSPGPSPQTGLQAQGLGLGPGLGGTSNKIHWYFNFWFKLSNQWLEKWYLSQQNEGFGAKKYSLSAQINNGRGAIQARASGPGFGLHQSQAQAPGTLKPGDGPGLARPWA